jgi:hypothetical protein
MAAARGAPAGAFTDPALAEQLIGDLRHRAALKTREARKIGAGYRPHRPDQLQDDVAVDPAANIIRAELSILQIHSPHPAI